MIGQSLSRYTIEAKLGEGGMGVVYKARDTQLERTVAIKVLPPDQLADPDRKRRFIQEARAASALNHPGIVTIYDVGSERNTDFIVMEYVAGRTLDQVVPAGGLALKKGLRFAIEIADAVARAHEAGIIHRDLKPANVMVTDAGGIKILDFGIAKLLESTTPAVVTKTAAVTQDGTTIGTPAYMSPEQADGQRVDARSDIFSFGSVLYEMMTGRQAFSGDSRLSVMARILNEDPVPPGRLAATIPADLEKVILRCLRKDPARRFQTMADLRVALEDLALESSAPAPLPPAPARSAPASSVSATMGGRRAADGHHRGRVLRRAIAAHTSARRAAACRAADVAGGSRAVSVAVSRRQSRGLQLDGAEADKSRLVRAADRDGVSAAADDRSRQRLPAQLVTRRPQNRVSSARGRAAAGAKCG